MVGRNRSAEGRICEPRVSDEVVGPKSLGNIAQTLARVGIF
jgi:hypothetical protein